MLRNYGTDFPGQGLLSPHPLAPRIFKKRSTDRQELHFLVTEPTSRFKQTPTWQAPLGRTPRLR